MDLGWGLVSANINRAGLARSEIRSTAVSARPIRATTAEVASTARLRLNPATPRAADTRKIPEATALVQVYTDTLQSQGPLVGFPYTAAAPMPEVPV